MKKVVKKTISVLLIATMVFSAAPLAGFVGLELPSFSEIFSTKAEAATEYTSGYYTYTVSYGKATITDVDTSISGDVIVPSTLGGYPVTNIGNYAFYDCVNLKSITIPDSVTSIGNYVFYYCTSLGSVTIGNGVTSIGNYVFYYCTSLKSVTIPDSVTSIGVCSFEDCTSLASVTIGNRVTSIGNYAFNDCVNLKSITIPNGVTSIGFGTFGGCTSLESVTIPDSVTNIGDYAFCNCTSLESVTIGNGVTSIGNDVFYNCTSLKSVTIPDSVTSIGRYAFYKCTNLKSVTIPDSVTNIGYYAFYYCTRLTSVRIPDSVTTIDDGAFAHCSSLTNVVIGNGVTNMGIIVFSWCDSLTSITVDPANKSYSSDEYGVLFKKNKTSLIQYPIGNARTNYEVPSGVQLIDFCAFNGCISLTEISIPNSMIYICDDVFAECCGLTDVYYRGTEEEWNAVSIDEGNDELLNATIHFGICCSVDCTVDNTEFEFFNGSWNVPKGSHFSLDFTVKYTLCEEGGYVYRDSDEMPYWANYTIYDENGNDTYISGKVSVSGLSATPIESGKKYSFSMDIGTDSLAPGLYKVVYFLPYVGCSAHNQGCTEWGSINILITDECGSLDWEMDCGLELNNGYLTVDVGSSLQFESSVKYTLCDYAYVERDSDSLPYWASYEIFYENGEPACLAGSISINGMNGDPIVSGTEYKYILNVPTDKLREGKYEIVFYVPDICCDTHGCYYNYQRIMYVEVVGHECCNLSYSSEQTEYEFYNGFSMIPEGSNLTINNKLVFDTCPHGYVESDSYGQVCLRYRIYDSSSGSIRGSGLAVISNGAVESGREYQVPLNLTTENLEPGEYELEFVYPGVGCEVHGYSQSSMSNPMIKIVENDTLVFDANGGSGAPQAMTDAVYYTIPSTVPAREGYVFEGWSPRNSDEIFKAGDRYGIFRGTTLYAVWKLNPEFVPEPSVSEISYGDSIVLHANVAEIPEGGYILWTASNGNFDYTVSADGKTCTITPSKSGDTTFTAVVYDAKGNIVSADEQTMTSKAGFFDKIIAFFKKLFGLTKTIPEVYKGIY